MRDPENYSFDNMCGHIEKWIENLLIILKGPSEDKIEQAIEYNRAILRNIEKMRRKYATESKTDRDKS